MYHVCQFIYARRSITTTTFLTDFGERASERQEGYIFRSQKLQLVTIAFEPTQEKPFRKMDCVSLRGVSSRERKVDYSH
jgi:hypothetical protein